MNKQSKNAKVEQAIALTVRHSAKFVLVDRRGQIRGYYNTDEPNGSAKLLEDARLLLAGG